MKIVIDAKNHTVSITGDFTGPYINLDVSAMEALELLRALNAQRGQIEDLATNYYECHECGGVHPNWVRPCPHINQEQA